MLKELNRLCEAARRQVAAWRRWDGKLPHNRVRRMRVRDAAGRPVGYGPPVPVPEPPLTSSFCERTALPSGRVQMVAADRGISAAYRQARRPRPTPAEVEPLLVTEEEIRRLFGQYCR